MATATPCWQQGTGTPPCTHQTGQRGTTTPLIKNTHIIAPTYSCKPLQATPGNTPTTAINTIPPSTHAYYMTSTSSPVLLATKPSIAAQLTTKLEQTAKQSRRAHDQANEKLAGKHTAKHIKAARQSERQCKHTPTSPNWQKTAWSSSTKPSTPF